MINARITTPKVFVDDSQSFDLSVRLRYLPEKDRREFRRGCTFAPPAHHEHMANLSSPMKEINFRQVDRGQKYRHSRPLSLAHNLVYLRFARDIFPQPKTTRNRSMNSVMRRLRGLPTTLLPRCQTNFSVQLKFCRSYWSRRTRLLVLLLVLKTG